MTDQQAGLAKKEHGVDFPLGLTSVRIPLPGTATEPVEAIFRNLVTRHGIPKIYQYDVFSRILLSQSVTRLQARHLSVSIRLMAVAAYIHTRPDPLGIAKVMPENTDLISEIVDLLQASEIAAPLVVKMSAMRCVMSFTQYQFRFVLPNYSTYPLTIVS